MSFKYQAQKVGDAHYVLPRCGSMKVEAHAFFSDDLYAASEESLWSQLASGASYDGIIGAYLMPDGHSGFGVPIGCVLVTENTIIQAGSGYDISCFTKDTLIPLVDGRHLTFGDLVEQYGSGGEFFVYSMTPEGRVTSGRAHSPRVVRNSAPIIEVVLDNGCVEYCTPDHEFMLLDGSYCEAKDLTPGVSLMPLYRHYSDGYCVVQHPSDLSEERMYQISFRELHGYIPKWPQVIHHDLFNEGNPNPQKTNDDPRFLVEMNQKDHFRLHSETARLRLDRGEIWGAKAHKLYPSMYSEMASRNMSKLHSDPEFKERHAKRMSETVRKVRASGGFRDSDAKAGKRGREYLITYNKSPKGRSRSRANGLNNKGRVRVGSKCQLKKDALRMKYPVLLCPHCERECFGAKGYSKHISAMHRNHKVVNVKPTSRVEDVYCFTVDKYSNFALSSGVFVHNCGVLYLKVNLSASAVRGWHKRETWVQEVEKRIATGVGSIRPKLMPVFDNREAQEILRYGAKALGVSADLCERQYIPVPQGLDFTKIERAYSKVLPQMGSVGGGNHFIELQADRDTGGVFVMVHCGSRGYGWQTANHYFEEGALVRGLAHNRREDSWLYIDEPLGKEYWAYHNSAANFAIANRHVIVHGIQEALQEVFKADSEVYYEISHNLVQEETLVLPDGTTKRGFVHRKGATRAFPAGHPDLVGTKWEKTGHPCLIPGSMMAGAAILFAEPGAYQTACSVNHGSGRKMARGEAKRKLEHKQLRIDEEMKTIQREFAGVKIEGIVGNRTHTPLDECGHVYKDLDGVLSVLETNGVARIAHRLYPVANIKGSD